MGDFTAVACHDDHMGIDLESLYMDLHRHPELSFQEFRTAAVVEEHLTTLGFDVHTTIGGTGVVGVLDNGDGPVVLLRADMDGLPVEELSGLDYASTATARDHTGQFVPVMHACGHDVHVTALIGAVEELVATSDEWAGTLIVLFQPAEEHGGGAQVMVDDGLYDLIPTPDVVLGQHVTPLPAGVLSLHDGVTMAGDDSLRITLHGVGGHGSRPEATVDPIVMAANVVQRLQQVVSRGIAATESVVITVGQLHAGTKNNIIPSSATLGLSVRTFDDAVRTTVLRAIERVVQAEAGAAGSPTAPEVIYEERYPVTVNHTDSVARLREAFTSEFGAHQIVDVGVVSGSEDVGNLALAAGAPLVYWFLGGADPALFEGMTDTDRMPANIPSNHSPYFAPVLQPTLTRGVEALVIAAREWLL
ncbi:amidohydrolase [Jonesia denitrificans DSM 20603]|uniref:Amidohydrolase n=2 Tax=Jonesia TaxID=43673 RepID=C7R4S9_JONDD|nr:amidohydrolase [Jonesia denitrificans DSM 20603]SQH19670.1 N-acyl-L-amino acid amidohydrolase [Jonesia denitrificans]